MAHLISVTSEKLPKKIVFKAVFLGIPLSDDAAKAQIQEGYHPAGHGSPQDLVSRNVDGAGKYEATWTCLCD